MKLHVAGVLGILVVALSTVGCGVFGGAQRAQSKTPVGTTTLTNAPMTPDPLLPLVIWDEDEEPITPAVETWGVRPPTDEELSKYGF